MPLYEYRCDVCGERFEKIKPISQRHLHDCPLCGQSSPMVFSSFYDHWGWILTEASHHRGATDTWVENRPSNEMIIDSEKETFTKTIF